MLNHVQHAPLRLTDEVARVTAVQAGILDPKPVARSRTSTPACRWRWIAMPGAPYAPWIKPKPSIRARWQRWKR